MSFDLDRYAKLRPFLYHLTASENVEGICATKRLYSAANMLASAGRLDLMRVRRKKHEVIPVDRQRVWLRDQFPLRAGNADLADSWSFEDLVKHLNQRVFFWPGTDDGPIHYGRSHFARYAHERPTILRVRFESLRKANPERTPLFCPYNSGAPRCSYGLKAPRGPDTFLAAEHFHRTASRVAEVTFLDHIKLPSDTEMSQQFGDSWTALF